jgi:hypothetical protein
MLKDKIMKKNINLKKLANLKNLTIITTWIKFDKEKKHKKDGIVKIEEDPKQNK